MREPLISGPRPRSIISAGTTSGFSVSTEFIGNPPMLLRARDAVAAVKPRQHELHARRPHRLVFARVHLERLLPRPRHPLEPFGVVARRQQVAHLDLDATPECLRDLVQTMLIDVL